MARMWSSYERSKVKCSWNPHFSTILDAISKSTNRSDIEIWPACSPFHSKQNEVSLQFIDGMFRTHSTYPGKEQRHSHRQNRLSANWVNGPDWRRIVWRGTINMSIWKITTHSVTGPQENPKTAKLATISRYVWVQPRSLTSDDLWKIKVQCQRSDMVISWPKSCISPSLPMPASYVTENIISFKSRSEAVPFMTS